ERMHQRMQVHPEMMVRRRSIVEHPFGNLKQWILGNGRFLLRQLQGARTEMALAVNAYNLKRAINVLGARRLIELLGSIPLSISMLQKHQRPEPVGALDFSGVSAFSHALNRGAFHFCLVAARRREQFDLVAVRILDEGQNARAVLHRAGLAGDLATAPTNVLAGLVDVLDLQSDMAVTGALLVVIDAPAVGQMYHAVCLIDY